MNDKLTVYITYDRYEHDEWFSIDQVTLDWEDVEKEWKKNLYEFINYGPDDCHSYQIQEVELEIEEYQRLRDIVDNHYDLDGEDNELMSRIFDQCDWNNPESCHLCTDGCSDFLEMINYYCGERGLDPEDEDVNDEVTELLQNDTKVFEDTLTKYIDDTYELR